MKDNSTTNIACGLVIGFCVGLMCGVLMSGVGWKSDIIQHGAAHYNTYTGQFEWNIPPIPTHK